MRFILWTSLFCLFAAGIQARAAEGFSDEDMNFLGIKPGTTPVAPIKKDSPSQTSASAGSTWDPGTVYDKNMDYEEQLTDLNLPSNPKMVKQPALGTRGYRPNLIAISYGERTPGVGGFIEYQRNRIGWGLTGSVRQTQGLWNQGFSSFYVDYRWLPFSFSPYILAGVGVGFFTPRPVGISVGAGVEGEISQGLTVTSGYIYSDVAKQGFLGGSVGWAF